MYFLNRGRSCHLIILTYIFAIKLYFVTFVHIYMIIMNNKHLKYIIFVLLFHIGPIVLPKQTETIEICTRNIPILDRLPTKAIHRIFQDTDGYIWYGTFDGLCRYDGYDIKTFRSDTQRPNLLEDNYITFITEDHKKQIWFGTFKGVYILNKETCEIRKVNLKNTTDLWVYSIYCTNDGTIWVSTPGILHHFNSDATLIKQYPLHLEGAARTVFLIYESHQGEMIVSTTGCGMYKLDKEKDELVPFYPHPTYRDIEKIIYDDNHNCYWVCTWGNGILRFDPKSINADSIYTPMPLPKDAQNRPSGNTYHMVMDDFTGYLWLTTERGIHAFEITSNKRLKEIKTLPFLHSYNKLLYEIRKDFNGSLWVSAFDIESFIIDFNKNSIREYTLPSIEERLRANPSILSLLVDSDGDFWFLQERWGLCLYNPRNNKLTFHSEIPSLKNVALSEKIIFTSSTSTNNIWIGTAWGTVYEIKKKGENIQRKASFSLHEVQQNPGSITSMFEDKNKKLWIGTTEGVFCYDIRRDSIETISIQNKEVIGFVTDTENRIWLAIPKQGLYTIENQKMVLKYSSTMNFTSIAITSDNILWIGTEEGGVYSYRIDTQECTDYSFQCGNENSRVNKIFVDKYNHVWTMGHQRIGIFNPKNGAKKTYRTGNIGFLLGRLSPNATYTSDNDTFYFGGVNGIISLTSSPNLEQAPQNVITHISDIKINGETIWNGTAQSMILSKEHIKITSDIKELQIYFSALDFSANALPRYACKLEGWDDDWILIEEGKNSISYSHLPKGKHTFCVKCTDSNGVWSNKETKIIIEKMPRFYETYWAYLIYILLTAGAIFIAGRIYLRYKEDKNKKEIIERMSWVLGLEQDGQRSKSIITSHDEEMINKATTIVEEHLSDTDFDVQILADCLNMSRSTLARKIRTITGTTPSDFIKGIKMKNAAEMLSNPNITISEVVNAVGYTNRKHFSTAFKNMFGISPSEYQKKKMREV